MTSGVDRVQTLFARAQLSWIQNKARPAFLCVGKHMLIVAKKLLVDSVDQYSNVLYKEAFIRKLQNPKGVDVDHTQHWFYHKDNKEKVEQQIIQLQTKYSTLIVGEMLGYIAPMENMCMAAEYKETDPTACLEWYINKKLIFMERIQNWELVQANKSHVDKFKMLSKALHSDLILELKICVTERNFFTSE